MRKKSIRTLSLFTGAGGLDIGFHQAGFAIIACVEIEPIFCQTLELNKNRYLSSTCKIINEDIRYLVPSSITSEKIDFIIGGPPCQSFSAAGRRAGGIVGIGDERGSLFEHYCRFISYFRPKGFLFENVRGILSSNKRDDWNAILNTFMDLGYEISFRVLDTVDYGVPQHRERLILVGTQKGTDFFFPRPTHGSDSKDNSSFVSCGEVIDDLQIPNEPVHDYGGKYGELLSLIPPGSNYLFFTHELGYPNPIFAWRSRFSDFLFKANPDYPVKTIVARMGAFSGPFHWKNRKFTIDEFKRLFTFPDDYELAGSDEEKIKQLGNSVPPRFAHNLALSIRQQIFEGINEIELLPSDTILSFDRRKGEKALATRKRRSLHKNIADNHPPSKTNSQIMIDNNTHSSETYYCSYPSWKERIKSEKPLENIEKSFEVNVTNESGNYSIVIRRTINEESSQNRLLQYVVKFHRRIGDGVSSISCDLYSNDDEDVVASWDAIEDCLNKHSSYFSMMDVFGHFTEPHPIFDLKLHLFGKQTFLLKFAKLFTDFKKIAVDFQESVLKSLQDSNDNFNFIDEVKKLRALRFDVRVYETNRTINPGYFRCCYPFTLHVDKQNSVSWSEDNKGNTIIQRN